MLVTLPDGREMSVPRGLMGHELKRYVDNQLKTEELERQKAAAQKVADHAAAEEDRFTALERQLAEERARSEALHKEIASLKKASPEAASMVTILSDMTRQANDAFDRNQKLLAAMNRFTDKKAGEIEDVAMLLAQQNQAIDAEQTAKRDASRRMMDDLRAQQGLERLHPELIEPPMEVQIDE